MYAILHELIDALFRIGGVNDSSATRLHGAVNEADPDFAAAAEKAATQLSDAERDELKRLQEKAALAEQASVPAVPGQSSSPAVPAPGFGYGTPANG